MISRDISQQLDRIFEPLARHDAPGCAVAIARNGEVIYAGGFGMASLEYPAPITPNTIFHVASVSKQFTGMAVMLLAQEGLLSLDDDVRRYLHWVPDFGQLITLRHLVHHTSGLRDQWTLAILAGIRLDDVITTQDLIDLVRRQQDLNFAPGSTYNYSNTGYTLLALVVESVTGMSFPMFCRQRIFEPLRMTQTHVHDDHRLVVPDRAYSYDAAPNGTFMASPLNYANMGATSLFTTALDLVKWSTNFESAQVGGKDGIALMTESGQLATGESVQYGFGLETVPIGGHRAIWHGGGDAAFRSHLLILPDSSLAVVILANVSTVQTSTLALRVAEACLDREPFPPHPEEAIRRLGVELLDTTVGQYRDVTTGVTVRLLLDEEGRPVVRGPQLLKLSPRGDLSFVAYPGGEEVTITEAAGGRPAVLEIRSPRRVDHASYVQEPFWKPQLASLERYVGEYYSRELDNTYRIRVGEVGLTVSRHHFPDQQLIPTYMDAFLIPCGWDPEMPIYFDLLFRVDSSGDVRGFQISTGRVNGLEFDRVEK